MILRIFLVLGTSLAHIKSQTLVVNIANKGGDIFQEKFDANATEDFLKLSFQQFDGTIIKHSIDFKSSIQTFHLTILPFRDLGETKNKEICFILPIEPGEFISSDAMSKLRQKNPHTIRRAEEELPKANFSMNHLVSQVSLAVLPRSVQELCSSMEVQTFAQSFDLLKWSVNDGPTGTTWSSGPCNATVSWNKACLCSYPLCVVWYPCDLKYCKSEQAGTDQLEYRCGIKTCAKCRIFTFEVRKKMDCLWNVIP